MKEYVELRVVEEHAHLVFRDDEGAKLAPVPWLGPLIRRVVISTSDPRMADIGRLQRELPNSGKGSFFFGRRYIRQYKRKELERAKLLTLSIKAVFEPTGEKCGTVIDRSTACPRCQTGATQRSDLILDLRKVPRSTDMARTIAEEWIINQRLAEVLADNIITGYELRPVRHKARFNEDPMDFTKLERGREAIAKARDAGCEYNSYSFAVWLARPEQAELNALIDEEFLRTKAENARRRAWKPPVWYQFAVTSNPVHIDPLTRLGIDPFDEDPDGTYRCPFGHTAGFARLSELYVRGLDYDGADFARTAELVGMYASAAPQILVSQRLFRLLRNSKIKGCEFEVAHLV